MPVLMVRRGFKIVSAVTVLMLEYNTSPDDVIILLATPELVDNPEDNTSPDDIIILSASPELADNPEDISADKELTVLCIIALISDAVVLSRSEDILKIWVAVPEEDDKDELSIDRPILYAGGCSLPGLSGRKSNSSPRMLFP